MLYRPRFPTVEASPVDEDGSMLVGIDPPMFLKVDANTFDALFEPQRKGRRRSAATRNHKQSTQAPQTIWDLMQQALRESPQSSQELFQYVTSRGRTTTNITVASILQTKRKAGLVDSPEERGGVWQLTK